MSTTLALLTAAGSGSEVCADAPFSAKSTRPLPSVLSSHIALLIGAAIYSGWNVIAAACLKEAHVNPLAFSVAREVLALPLLYFAASILEYPLVLPTRSTERLLFAALGFLLGAFQVSTRCGKACLATHHADVSEASCVPFPSQHAFISTTNQSG